VLVEHYVARGSQTSMIGNVFLGRVQNVLPSMEAAFIDIGKGRNAVLYAGEVDWKALSGEGRPRRIEEALSSGQSVLVQVTKDPVGNKGARLTSQVSLPGRFLVYVPGGHTSGISRKLPDTERNRLKTLLKDIVPGEAGVIVRTAAEGATEDQLSRDVAALTARWEDISRKAIGQGPKLLYAEPDLMIKVVRDLYNEDFKGLTVQGEEAWEDVQSYVDHVAPDLGERLQRWDKDQDVFAAYRIDEQVAKGTDRKVWLPSGGSLVIDRTEAMTVVDVNTGKFTGSGGNLEETVTKNNLEAAEEFVRQLRLRDIGGIIVIDFIDMVLEDNRDLVLRRLVECLGRDRTRHQVAEVTSLGLVQMTRKRIGTGLLEAFSEPCTCCQGRGFHVLPEPVAEAAPPDEDGSARGRGGEGRARGRGRTQDATDAARSASAATEAAEPRPRARPRPPEPKGIAAEPTPTEPTPTEPTPTEPTPTEPDPAAVGPSPTPEPEVLATPAESSVPAPEDEQVPEPEPKRKRARRAPRSTPKLSADAVAVATADADNSDEVSRTTALPASAKSPEDSEPAQQ
jgi:ribonuclease E